MKPSQLVKILIEKFDLTHQQDDHFKPSNTTEDFLQANSRQQGIRSFLCIWLSTYWNDFRSSDTRRMLLDFLDSISNYQELSPICDILFPLATRIAPLDDKDASWGMSALKSSDTVQIKGKSASGSFLLQKHKQQQQQQQNKDAENKEPSFHFGGGIIPLHHDHAIVIHDHEAQFDMLMSLTPTKLAEQLTWIDLEIFKKIQPRDFLRQLWASQERKRSSSRNPVSASIEHFNFVSGWIASLVVNQTLIEKRVRVLEFCWKVAVELKCMNNFNTLMAVMAGVNSAAVLRLKKTRSEVQSKNKKLYDQYLELEALMSSGGGIHQQDLVSLGQANKDYKANGKVHWKKFQLIGDCIQQVMRFRYPTYTTLEADSVVMYFIGHEGTVATEDVSVFFPFSFDVMSVICVLISFVFVCRNVMKNHLLLNRKTLPNLRHQIQLLLVGCRPRNMYNI
ncbi:ras guanine nucleotide exchange factor domain-containing protein [Parasitella parasitica]|nr:ras guanine nucleotide exchange factor domain-containing protein [Parasitella parasitica]